MNCFIVWGSLFCTLVDFGNGNIDHDLVLMVSGWYKLVFKVIWDLFLLEPRHSRWMSLHRQCEPYAIVLYLIYVYMYG